MPTIFDPAAAVPSAPPGDAARAAKLWKQLGAGAPGTGRTLLDQYTDLMQVSAGSAHAAAAYQKRFVEQCRPDGAWLAGQTTVCSVRAGLLADQAAVWTADKGPQSYQARAWTYASGVYSACAEQFRAACHWATVADTDAALVFAWTVLADAAEALGSCSSPGATHA